MVKFDQLFRYKLTFSIKIDFFELKIDFFDILIDYFDYLIDYFDLFMDLLIEIDQIQIENDRDLIKFAIVDSNLALNPNRRFDL